MSEQELKIKMCELGKNLWTLGFVAANDGNMSVKIGEDEYLTTPTGVSKSILTPDMIIKCNGKGEVIEGNPNYRPSSELPMHLRCYKERPDIKSVIHAHPPTATAFACSGQPLDSYIMPEAIIFVGAVPIAKYGTPSTNEIPDAVAEFLPEHDVILLENHGALTVGADLVTAYYRMETLEHYAKISYMARQLGGEKELNEQQIKDCLALRDKFKVPGKHPGYKKFSK